MSMKKILVFGTFDLLHPGHRYFLQQAKKNGDVLIVVVARNVNVKMIKGYYPIDSERKRCQNLRALPEVSKVILGYKDFKQREKILTKIKPDLICAGYDQKIKLSSKAYKIKRLKAYYPKKYKSSLLRKTISNLDANPHI